jgi:hypothetical protein
MATIQDKPKQTIKPPNIQTIKQSESYILRAPIELPNEVRPISLEGAITLTRDKFIY